METYKTGDRVIDEYLGEATIVKHVDGDCYIIITDKPAPVQYNGGQRRCVRFAHNFKREQSAPLTPSKTGEGSE